MTPRQLTAESLFEVADQLHLLAEGSGKSIPSDWGVLDGVRPHSSSGHDARVYQKAVADRFPDPAARLLEAAYACELAAQALAALAARRKFNDAKQAALEDALQSYGDRDDARVYDPQRGAYVPAPKK